MNMHDLVLHLLLLLNPWLIVEIWPVLVFSIGITLVGAVQNWLNWFHFDFPERGLLVILIDCIIFLSPFLDLTRMFISPVSFLAKLDSLNSLPVECFPLTSDLSGFRSRINKHHLTVGSF